MKALLAIVCVGQLVRAQVGETAPSPQLDACREAIGNLDRVWNAGLVDPYLRLFAPEQPLLHDLHSRQTRERLGARHRLVRTSTLGTPRTVGERIVVPVHWQTSPADVLTESAPQPLREQGLVVLRRLGDRLQPVLAVQLPDTACADDDHVSCRACNYNIGPAPGWLCVPIAREATAAVEAATFLLLGTDIALELTVQLADAAEPARDCVRALAQRLAAAVPDTTVGDCEPWQPPAIAADLPGISAARIAVDFPDGQRTVLHTLAIGRLRHLLLLRGRRDALSRATTSIGDLFATYHLLQTDVDAATTAAQALHEHTGGEVRGDHYRNVRYGIEAAGPPGWRPSQRCTGACFAVLWSCPAQSGNCWLLGYAPPSGLTEWTTELADRWLLDAARRGEFEIHAATDSDWGPADAAGVRTRSLVVPSAGDATPDSPRRAVRHARLWLRRDLLVVTFGYTTDRDQEAALRHAVASVQAR